MGSGYDFFWLIGVYGHLEPSCLLEVWDLLRNFKNDEGPMVRVGDYNEVLKVSEKWGSRTWAERQMDAFWDCITNFELEDLGYFGPPFTWCNNCEGDQRILERIDHALANSGWSNMFPNASVFHGLLILIIVPSE